MNRGLRDRRYRNPLDGGNARRLPIAAAHRRPVPASAAAGRVIDIVHGGMLMPIRGASPKTAARAERRQPGEADPASPQHLITEAGLGYRLEV